jgi:hypothetical protein
MRTYFYYKALRRTIINFLDAFNDIKIVRYLSDGTTIDKYIEVPVKLAGKEKTWYWLNERKDDQVLPMITAWISTIDFAIDRKVNSLANVCQVATPSAGDMTSYLHPLPYNLTFTMNIWSLHMSDTDQILEQILPYFEPFIFIKVNIPEVNSTFDVKVIFESCTPEIVTEIPDDNYRIINYTLNFQVQTYMFKPIATSKIIKSIATQYYLDADMMEAGVGSGTLSAAPSGGFQQLITGSSLNANGDPIFTYEEFN